MINNEYCDFLNIYAILIKIWMFLANSLFGYLTISFCLWHILSALILRTLLCVFFVNENTEAQWDGLVQNHTCEEF